MINSISIRATLLAAAITIITAPAAAQNRSYYVDYEGGSDSANGLTPATAWKHGPGDTAGAGAARNIVLKPGDRVLLKGGVRYRGTLHPRGAGTPDNPVVIDGSGWGPLRAIVDGSQPLTDIRRCKSAADCLGSPHWAKLWRGTLPAGTLWTDWLFVNDVAMQLGQYPDGLSRVEAEDPEKLLTVPLSQRVEILGGQIRHPLPPGLNAGQPVLGLWVRSNYLAFTDNVTVSTAGASFAGATWIHAAFDPYTDRDSRFTILNAPAMVSKPGRFAISAADGVAVFSLPPSAAALSSASAFSAAPRASVGAGRNGINTGRLSHAVVRGFSLANFAARPKNYASGIAIHGNPGSTGITIADNSLRAVTTMATRMGVMHFVRARDLKLVRNQMTNLPNSSGIMVDMSEGPVELACNQISDLGRTAIRFNNVLNGRIRGNRISGVFGIHGNGISLYNDNRAILVEGNVVTEAYRPLTMHGAGNSPYFQSGDYSVVVRNNVFLGSSTVNGAVATYSKIQNLSLVDNRIAAPRYAVKLSGAETGFHASGNQIVGAVAEPKGSTLFNPALNSSHAPDGNGALLVERWQTQQVPTEICS